jgi:hypothetical protein
MVKSIYVRTYSMSRQDKYSVEVQYVYVLF